MKLIKWFLSLFRKQERKEASSGPQMKTWVQKQAEETIDEMEGTA